MHIYCNISCKIHQLSRKNIFEIVKRRWLTEEGTYEFTGILYTRYGKNNHSVRDRLSIFLGAEGTLRDGIGGN